MGRLPIKKAWGWLAGAGLLLAACSSSPPPAAEDPLQDYLATAWQPPVRYLVQAGKARWTLGDTAVEVAWLVPRGVARAPLIVYLPGLGETAEGGGQWRRAWAEAGYAVLSLQAPEDGRAVYRSKEARTGNFRTVARQAFAESAVQARARQVVQALGELRQQAAQGDLVFSAIDFRRWLVAGFDLGARTAAWLAGARDSGQTPLDPAPLGAVLLSPYAEENAADAARFARLQGQLLSVTGPRDEDPFNWVAHPGQRLLPWQNSRTPGCQLLLAEATHQTLSGGMVSRLQSMDAGDEPQQGDSPPGRGRRPAGRLASQMSDDRQGSAEQGRGGRAGPDDGRNTRREPGRGAGDLEPPVDYRQRGAIQAISIAFLEARISHQSQATQWLNGPASQWLSGQGSLVCRP